MSARPTEGPLRFLRTAATFFAVVIVAAGVTLAGLCWLPSLVPDDAHATAKVVTWPAASAERIVPKPPDPVERFTIVAVGDIMAHMPQVQAARTASGYDFGPSFAPAAPRISAADLAIGNLETVTAGSGAGYTGYPSFNTPDEFAQAAVGAGFDVLTNANNHILDRGAAGITRTLDVLDALGVLHTGAARSAEEAGRVCMADVRGVKIAVIAYTYGMNGLSTPAGKSWMVNVIDRARMTTQVTSARAAGADLVIVSIHNGTEYQRQPSAGQTALAQAMIDAGADVVLGSHPHVIQPMDAVAATSADGSARTAFVIHSLGNFVSSQRPRYRDTGIILQLSFEKNLKTGVTTLLGVSYVPVWVDETDASGDETRVLPIGDVLADPAYPGVTDAERVRMQQAWDDTTAHLGSIDAASADAASVPFFIAPAAE